MACGNGGLQSVAAKAAALLPGDCLGAGQSGKPAPDLYLYAADQLGADIARTVILEDSKVGATGALASGARVIGLAAGAHCLDGHADKLRAVGVRDIAHSFEEVARLVGLDQPSR